MWNPWNWVIGAWDASFGGLKSLYQWILNAFGAVYDYIASVVQQLQDAINAVVTFAQNLAAGIDTWATTWFKWVIGWITYEVNWIVAWVGGLVADIRAIAERALSFATWVYDYLRNWMWSLIQNVYLWVQDSIAKPLWNYITGMFAWVTRDLATVLQYIEHPELFAVLMARAVAPLWYYFANRIAVPITRWLMRSMQSLTGELFDLIESVISSVL